MRELQHSIKIFQFVLNLLILQDLVVTFTLIKESQQEDIKLQDQQADGQIVNELQLLDILHPNEEVLGFRQLVDHKLQELMTGTNQELHNLQ